MRVYYYCALLSIMSMWQWVSAASQSYFMANRLKSITLEEEREEQKWVAPSPLFWASKALGTLIGIASNLYQWLSLSLELNTQKPLSNCARSPVRLRCDSCDSYEYE